MGVLGRIAGFALVAAAGCGTLAPEGGGANELPTSGAGPYHKSTGQSSTILADARASLDDAQLLVDGDALTVYFTRAPGDGTATIQRARFPKLGATATATDTALAASEPWESRAVSQPAVLAPAAEGGAWLLFFAAGGTIGLATSDDGATFAARGPLVGLAPGASSPAAVRVGDRVRLYSLAAGAIFAADVDPATLAATPLDGDPATPAIDPIVRPGDASWLEALGRCTARAVETPAGRARYDLFLSGASAGVRVVGLAGSFDGLRFEVAPAPFLDPKPPDKWAPTVAAYGAGSLLLYSTSGGRFSDIAAAESP